MAPEQEGRWSEPIVMANIAVHLHLLPNGKVLQWGRRDNPRSPDPASLDQHYTRHAWVWDPITRETYPTANEPVGEDGVPVNIFCAGHSFLADGTLLITGGHWVDGHGIDQNCTYDYRTNTFTTRQRTNNGRWYPSLLTMPDGRVFCSSGSFNDSYEIDNVPQIWDPRTNSWIEAINSLNQVGLGDGKVIPLYPRMHLSPDGRVIVVGPLSETWWFDLKDPANPAADIRSETINPPGQSVVGRWSNAYKERRAMFRDYCPSVQYDTGKIMYLGGGLSNDFNTAPTTDVEYLDLNPGAPGQWQSFPSGNMIIPRRQFNATILPDGSVFVNGGSKGAGFNNFNDPALDSELWNPDTRTFTKMAPERYTRCYHGTSLLLPDGRVISAGSGEYMDTINLPDQCHTEAQIFEPPYLFKTGAPRPNIVACPSEIKYATSFILTIAAGNTDIGKISWIRLGSTTHCRNMGQSCMFLPFAQNQDGMTLSVQAPGNANLAPPGHYMLFVVDRRGVPSVAKIMRISETGTPVVQDEPPQNVPSSSMSMSSLVQKISALMKLPTTAQTKESSTSTSTSTPASTASIQPTLFEHAKLLATQQQRPPMVVALSPACPYGLGPCWGGAYDGLTRICDIEAVSPVPNQADALAYIYLNREMTTFPDIDTWREEFSKVVNASYEIRGIEMILEGMLLRNESDQLVLRIQDPGTKVEGEIPLRSFGKESQLKWDVKKRENKEVTDDEKGALNRLVEDLKRIDAPETRGRVTGTLQKDAGCAGGFALDVREFELFQ
ncbi:hypothetical protein V8F20_002894 [Naviculisporaceae sp. PSN 640]